MAPFFLPLLRNKAGGGICVFADEAVAVAAAAGGKTQAYVPARSSRDPKGEFFHGRRAPARVTSPSRLSPAPRAVIGRSGDVRKGRGGARSRLCLDAAVGGDTPPGWGHVFAERHS